jgi:hypothetical protein
MEISKWYPVVVLEILLTGAVFLLLDMNFPVDRLQRICSNVKVGDYSCLQTHVGKVLYPGKEYHYS